MATTTTVKVLVRVRPLNGKEGLSGDGECVAVTGSAVQVRANAARAPESSVFLTPKVFTFDYAFDAFSSQEHVFEAVVPLVHRFVDGFNATVLAYGQTGSGKTWTMGTGLELMPDQLRGIVPRAIDLIFQTISDKSAADCSLAVSFLELYNEELVDLLNPVIKHSRPNTASSSHSNNPGSSQSNNPNAPNIREDAHGHIVWSNVREEPVTCPQDLVSCLQRGSLCRSTGSTDMNAASSRSHAIFTIILKQKEKVSSELEDASDGSQKETQQLQQQSLPQTYRTITSKFHFVDLAGSERLKRTNAEGDRKKEGISINQGLLALGNCISALGDESRRPGAHIPYRDSKLTRMLQDSLGGNSQTLMIACVSPSESSYGETVSTLTYANRARNIKNKSEVVQEFTGAGSVSAAAEKEIRGLRALVADLRDEINTLRGNSAGSGTGGFSNTQQASHAAAAAHERDFQIHLQEERELASALDDARQESQIARFEADRYAFKCCRLMERSASTAAELQTTKIERDLAVVELDQWRTGKKRFTVSTEEGLSDNLDQATRLISECNTTITELRFKLNETSDRLAWYNEVVDSFGNEESRHDRIITQFLSLPGNAEEVPSPKTVRTTRLEENPAHEVGHEGRVVKALKTDVELGQALLSENKALNNDNDGQSPQPRLFGLPKSSTATFHHSNLTQETNFVTDDEDGENSASECDSDEELDNDYDESIAHDDTPLPPPSSGSSKTADKSTDIYLLIHRLQTDISQHQALIDKHAKREQEYQAFREAYESKLCVLQNQIQNVGKERDEALKRVKGKSNGSGNPGGGGERPGTAAIKQRYDEQKRKLELEISEYKRKMREKEKENGRGRNEGLTKQLMQTIESLKAEKFKALKELKKESNKIREVKTTKEREIARLKKREKAATELAKRLERSNQLQKIAIKRRSEDYAKSQANLKTLKAAMLKQSTATQAVSNNMEGHTTTLRSSKRLKRGSKHLNSLKEDEALMRALKIGIPGGSSGAVCSVESGPPMEIRSKFKKQMIDKELIATVGFRISELELNVMYSARDRLIGEQRELLAERERCVAAEAEMTGVWDTQKPQYMDDRLGVIDMEVAVLNARIRSMLEEIKLGKAAASLPSAEGDEGEEVTLGFETTVTHGNLGWENAVNLLRSLDSIEMEYVAVLLLQDIVDHKITVKSMETKIADCEKNIIDLHSSLATMRGAALQTAVDYRKEMENIRALAEQKISSVMAEYQQTKPSSLSRSRSSLFSYDEFGAATPKLQKMFDSAYGHGFVVLKPSRRGNHVELIPDTESIARGVETALRREQEQVSSISEDENGEMEDMDLDSDSHSPVRQKTLAPHTPAGDSTWIPPKSKALSPPRRYNLRPRSRRVSTDKENEELPLPSQTTPSISEEPHDNSLEPDPESSSIVYDLPPPSPQQAESTRGRTDLRSLLSPLRISRASSVPSSPAEPNSNKSIIYNFIKSQRSKTSRNALNQTPTIAELELNRVSSEDGSTGTSEGNSIIVDVASNALKKKASRVAVGPEISTTQETGSDVFSRLATKHTLASQAKVIHRDSTAMDVPVFGDVTAPRKLSIGGSMAESRACE